MANPVLAVEIGAEINNLTAKLKEAGKDVSNFVVGANGELIKFDKSILVLERQLKSFQNGLKNTLDPSRINLLNNAIKVTEDRLSSTKQVINGVGLNKLTVGSNQAAFALNNLGRVAQDAPFGFIGIQNNLNPLLESFQQLRKESGSNVGALKALGQSLIGPAGIGLALSAVSAGILLYQKFQQSANKETEQAAKNTKDLAESFNTYDSTLSKANSSALEEINQLDLLVKGVKNSNLAQSERIKFADKLKETYPDTFKNLTTEQILTADLTKEYSALKKELFAVAFAKAAANKAEELGGKLIDNLIERKNLQAEVNKLTVENNKLLPKSIQELVNNGSIATRELSGIASKYSKQIAIYNENNKKIAENTTLLKNNASIVVSLNKDINDTNSIQAKLQNSFGFKTIETQAEQAKNKVKELKEESSKIKRIEAIGAEFTFDTLDLFNIDEFVNKTKTPEVRLGVKIKPVLEIENVFTDAELQTVQFLQKFNDSANSIINGGIADTFSGLASVIGNGIANGGNVIGQLGSVLLGSFGNIAIQLGQLAIGTGIAVEGIKKALTSLSGPIAIAAGVALVALGSFVKSAAGNIASNNGGGGDYKIPGFATGVTNFGGGVALVGERGPELVTLGRGSNVITNENISRFGKSNNEPQIFIPDTVLRGQDILISYNRANTFNKRR